MSCYSMDDLVVAFGIIVFVLIILFVWIVVAWDNYGSRK